MAAAPTPTLYFYDLETSGINPHKQRIMQFGGVRTTMDLKPIGEPDNILIRFADDLLPEPDAILITGITPQATRMEGITEAEFMRYFSHHIATPGTIFMGFNTVRFDDEFMRCLHFRNFYDPYEWQWKESRSRWDLLDVVRMTRALRPEGIEWPIDDFGRPTNRLELLTALNKLEHRDAHDALSDVYATISVANLIRNKQQKLFDYLLKMRDKKEVAALVRSGEPFVYSSGKYPSAYEKTTVVTYICDHPGRDGGALVYDLRTDPARLQDLTPTEIAKAWRERVEDETQRFPVKVLKFNRCPAVAPLGVLASSPAAIKNIKIDLEVVKANRAKLKKMKDLEGRLCETINALDKERQTAFLPATSVDGKLYDGFAPDGDKAKMSMVRAAETDELSKLDVQFTDERLTDLLPLYKARNFPSVLTGEEREAYEAYRGKKLMDGGAKSEANRFFTRLSELAAKSGLSEDHKYLLQELQLWGESIIPEPQ